MPKIISPDAVNKAIICRLEGKSRKETADVTGISETKVQQIWTGFRNQIGEANYEALSKIGEFTNSKGLSFVQWVDEFCFRKSLARLGVKDDENLKSFADDLYNYCLKNNLKPDTIINEIVNQRNLSERNKIPIGRMSEYFSKLSNETKKLEKEKKALQQDVAQLKIEAKKAEQEKLYEIEQKNATIKELNEHLEVKNELEKENFSITDVCKLKNILRNAREDGYSGPKLLKRLSDEITLTKQIQNQKLTIRANDTKIGKQANTITQQGTTIQKNFEIIKNQGTKTNQLKRQEKRVLQSIDITRDLYENKISTFEKSTKDSLDKLQQHITQTFDQTISAAITQQQGFFSQQQSQLSQMTDALSQSIVGMTAAVQNAASLKAIQPLYRLLCLKATPLEAIQAMMLPLDSFIIIYSNESNYKSSTLATAKNFQRSLQGDLKRQF